MAVEDQSDGADAVGGCMAMEGGIGKWQGKAARPPCPLHEGGCELGVDAPGDAGDGRENPDEGGMGVEVVVKMAANMGE